MPRLKIGTRGSPLALAQASDIVALGPGLGRSAALQGVVSQLLAKCTRPLVLDADGLNNLGEASDHLSQHAGQVVITPHPGEFARLLHVDTATVQANRRDLAVQFRDRITPFRISQGKSAHAECFTMVMRVSRDIEELFAGKLQLWIDGAKIFVDHP